MAFRWEPGWDSVECLLDTHGWIRALLYKEYIPGKPDCFFYHTVGPLGTSANGAPFEYNGGNKRVLKRKMVSTLKEFGYK